MLLTISTTHQPATDLGFLLHKNPENVHEVQVAFGRVTMFFPEVNETRCTFAMTLEIDPIALVRGKSHKTDGLLDQYVNDRPYAASSFLSVAMGRSLNTAFGGRSKHRQELAETEIPLEATITPLPCRGGPEFVARLFEPLGYEVEFEEHLLDPEQPQLGKSPYVSLKLAGNVKLKNLLEHLYVLIPVLDNSKHYFVDDNELEKLLRKGEDWLKDHPEKDLISLRYMKHRRGLARKVIARLTEDDAQEDALDNEQQGEAEDVLEKPIRLHELRLDTVAAVLKNSGAKRVLDLGCGEGKLIRRLLKEKQFEYVAGVDVSVRSLEWAAQKLKLDFMADRQRERVKLMHGALTYRDERFSGFDAIALVEVIEHLDEDRLPAMVRTVFEFARPQTVVITTPNQTYNAKFENLDASKMRHPDHRFEWTAQEFELWANACAETHGYNVEFKPLGELDSEFGAPSQMGIFTR